MAGRGDDHVVAHLLEVGDWCVVDAAVGDERREVVGGMRLALGGQLAEVAVEVHDHVDHLLGRQHRALQVGVFGAEQLLGELDHPRVVGLGQAEDRQDDL